jgi:hypothetical protein
MPNCYYWNLPMYWTYQPKQGHSKGLYFFYDFLGTVESNGTS